MRWPMTQPREAVQVRTPRETQDGSPAEVLVRTAPKASFIPEIWQGHKNGGEGFWTAFERLEPFFKQAGTASAMECIKTWRGT